MAIKKALAVAALAAGMLQAAVAAIPLDGRVYDAYLKTSPGKERKAFLREAFGGGQFDMRDLFELVERTKEDEWDVKKAATLDKLVRRGLGRAGGAASDCGRRIVAVRERVVEPIKKKYNIIVDGVHAYSTEGYVEPKSPAVREALERFRDRKLGLMVHFGIYTQLGIIESWPLVDKEACWARRSVDWQTDGEAFKKEYWSMIASFNPVRLQPEVWAETARRNGFKYLVFTTKHHDGFCLFDSKYSDFKVTNPACPFSKNPNADIAKAVFDAFRAKGLVISCYFSKPDWHHPDYWENHGLGQYVDRMPTYDVEEHPERWARYREFVRNQLLELTRDYGPLDQLWLDGGQVQKHQGLDIRIEEIVEEARRIQPALIAVDRATGTACENIVTPEQTVPPVPMMVPWESCITMGTGFSYRYDDTFKSERELIHLLIDVVAKGGNLALNVAPGPDGRFPAPAVQRMDAMGEWLARNGKAIYGTRVLKPYRVGEWAFTVGKKGEKYAIRLWQEKERGMRRLALPDGFGLEFRTAVRLATGAASPIAASDGQASFDLAADDRPDAYADAFELR